MARRKKRKAASLKIGSADPGGIIGRMRLQRELRDRYLHPELYAILDKPQAAQAVEKAEELEAAQSAGEKPLQIEDLSGYRKKAQSLAVQKKNPPRHYIQAYRLFALQGETQVKIAETMTQELQRPVVQGQISRWLIRVDEWRIAGNVLPDLTPGNGKPVKTVNLGDKIDLGKRGDGLSERQREATKRRAKEKG